MSLSTPIKPLVLVGCSGSGRSALIYHLTRHLPNKFQRLIPYTTRKPRPKQVNNRDFYFVDQKWIKQNQSKFVTLTYSINKNYYGLTKQQINRVMNKNKIPIFKLTLDAYSQNFKKQTKDNINSNSSNQIPSNTQKGQKQRIQSQKIEPKPLNSTYTYLIKDKKTECNALYIRIPSIQEMQRRLKFSPMSVSQQAQKIQKAKLEHNEAQKYFFKQDIIGKYVDPNREDDADDFQDTIIRVQSRLFQLY